MTIFDKVHTITQSIPKGKVTTYGEIARVLSTNPRTVGWALHANKSAKTPCHRVVNINGRLAPNFAFDGAKEQKRRLQSEGVKFKDDIHVDLLTCLYRFSY